MSNLGFPGISWRTYGGNGLKYSMLLYPDHLQNWLDYGYGLVIFLILVLFWLSETGQMWGFLAFSGKPIEEMAWILNADVSWPLSALIRLWLQFVDFSNFDAILLFCEMGKIWGFQAFWLCSVDFPHYGDPLAEIGHIWGFWALLRASSQEIPQPSITEIICKVKYLKFHSNFPGANELTALVMIS